MAPRRPGVAMSGGQGGFVGPLPRRPGLVDEGLGSDILTRWDRWFELVSGGGPPGRLHPDRPAWRLMARPGLFGAAPVAGCFRLGQDLRGRLYPVAVLRPGDPPDPADPWYDAAEALVRAACGGDLGPRDLAPALDRLPAPLALTAPPEETALLWRDDWQVRVIRCATPADLAAFPLEEAAELLPVDDPA